MQRIRLHGEEYGFVGTDDLNEGANGAIAPLEHLGEDGELDPEAAFEISYAHLYEDGTIWRFGEQIGTREDIEVL